MNSEPAKVITYEMVRGDDAADLSRRLNQMTGKFSVAGVSQDIDRRPFAIIERVTQTVPVELKQIKKLKGV